MGLLETEAIVLRTYKLAEADKIVVFLTQKFGVMRGVAKGARRLKSKFGAALEPFTLIGMSCFEKEGQELVSISQAEILQSHFELSADSNVVAALDYLNELILEFSPPNESNEKLFRMLKASLEAASQRPEISRLIVLYSEVWLLKLSGFLPDIGACSNCKTSFRGTNLESTLRHDGSLSCVACSGKHDLKLSSETNRYLRATERAGPLNWSQTFSVVSKHSQEELKQMTQSMIARALEKIPRVRLPLK